MKQAQHLSIKRSEIFGFNLNQFMFEIIFIDICENCTTYVSLILKTAFSPIRIVSSSSTMTRSAQAPEREKIFVNTIVSSNYKILITYMNYSLRFELLFETALE